MRKSIAGVVLATIATVVVASRAPGAPDARSHVPALPLKPHIRTSAPGLSAPLRSLAVGHAARGVRIPAGTPSVRLDRSVPHSAEQAPATTASFDGIANSSGVAPPDPNGDVGTANYVQVVNAADGAAVAVFGKDGALESGPVAMTSLWSGSGDLCETNGQGDPIAQYDQLADRWVLSQFAFTVRNHEPRPPFLQCVAVSTSPDPAGAYFTYSFQISSQYFGDYPKFGVWPDAYYLSVHLVDPDTEGYVAQGVIAFDRETMLTGGRARGMIFFANSSVFGLLPSDAQGPTPPPVGAPNYLVTVRDGAVVGGEDRLDLYRFHVDWDNPSASKITGPVRLPTESFDSNLCNGAQSCIPQRGTNKKLDPVAVSSLGDLIMYPLVYRNFGDFDALAFDHSVDSNHQDHAAPRWYEIANPGSHPFIADQGTYAPDETNRWMGSVSLDRSGDLALGFSLSDSTTFPSVGFTARAATDPAGTMGQGEGVIVAGGGSQTGTNRWGDYSAMQVDPSDDCTFWYTQEYYADTNAISWRTRIASFSLPSCGGPAPSPSPPPPDTRAPRITHVGDSPDPFHPGASGKKGRVKIKWTVSESSDNKVLIENRKGHVVRKFAGSVDAGSYYVTWRGTTDRGKKAPSGRYTYVISATDSSGNRSTAKGKTTLKR